MGFGKNSEKWEIFNWVPRETYNTIPKLKWTLGYKLFKVKVRKTKMLSRMGTSHDNVLDDKVRLLKF